MHVPLPSVPEALPAQRDCRLSTPHPLLTSCIRFPAWPNLPARRTAALLVNGLVAQRTSDTAHASVLLTKALKTAHAHLGDTQMVAQVGGWWWW